MKDKLVLGTALLTLQSITSWEACSQECRSRSTCGGWTWYSPNHHNEGVRGNCVLNRMVEDEYETRTKFAAGCISGGRNCVGSTNKKVRGPQNVPDASALLLNDKLYFCAFVYNDELSSCYKHEVNRYVVEPIASSIVSVLGGYPYSNTLYGRDARGQLVKFNTRDTSYTLMSDSLFETVKSKSGFVAAKSYNRSVLLNTSLTGEFAVYGKKYGITYYGIYDEAARSHLIVWLPENDCQFKAASTQHTALKSCKEIGGYCEQQSVEGMYWVRKPPPFSEMLVWCNFHNKEEMHIIVDENPVAIQQFKVKRLPELKSEYRIEFDFKMKDAIDLGTRARYIFQMITYGGKSLTGMSLRESRIENNEYYKTKLFEIKSYGATAGED